MTLVVIIFLAGVRSQITEKVANVGETITLDCGHSNPLWYKNGTKLNDTDKIKSNVSTLSIFCGELSDNGVYECRDGFNKFRSPRKYNVIVNNPGSCIFYEAVLTNIF